MYKILVVDDERWIRKGIVRMIDKDTLQIEEVFEAETVEDALAIFRKEIPDIVLSDVMFPRENGCDLGDQIYAIKKDTKIIMISAYDDFENARRALQFAAVDYLLKPVSKEKLRQVLKKCVEQIKEEHQEEPGTALPEQVKIDLDVSDESSRRKIQEMVEKIQKNYAKHYALSEMAAECCITDTYFSALFKKVTGYSPVNYIAKVRVDKAKELIMTTEYKMIKIANLVGYGDYQYFVKVFKRVAKVTPKEYKAGLENEIDS